MQNVDLANAIIAAALIQSGQFKLSEFDERGYPSTAVSPTIGARPSASCVKRRF